jgi:hypothetical protein
MCYSIRNFKAYTIMPKACATDMKEEKAETAQVSDNALPEECQRTSEWMVQALRVAFEPSRKWQCFGNFPSFSLRNLGGKVLSKPNQTKLR